MSATNSSLQSFNTPLGSTCGQTDVTVTFLCSFQHLEPYLDEQRTPTALVILERNKVHLGEHWTWNYITYSNFQHYSLITI